MEEKILEKLEALEKKVDELTEYVKSKYEECDCKGTEHTYTPESVPEAPKPSEIAAKMEDDNLGMMLESERIVCPKCQSISVQAMDNKETTGRRWADI